MTTQGVTKEKRVCKNPDCLKEYQARIFTVLNTQLVQGQGYCPGCVKKQAVKEEAKEKAIEDARVKQQRRLWRSACGISPMFMNERFDTFDRTKQPEAYKVCLDYANKYPLDTLRGYHSLLLLSDHSWGVGKTHLASSIGHKIIDRWNGSNISCPVLFISEPELYTRIQASYNFTGEGGQRRENEASIIWQLINVRLLIMDDVGKRRVSDPKFVQRIMFSIIDGRYREMLPMVITANLEPGDLAVYLSGGQGDEASMDRLVEMCKGASWRLEGDSFRAKKAKG